MLRGNEQVRIDARNVNFEGLKRMVFNISVRKFVIFFLRKKLKPLMNFKNSEHFQEVMEALENSKNFHRYHVTFSARRNTPYAWPSTPGRWSRKSTNVHITIPLGQSRWNAALCVCSIQS